MSLPCGLLSPKGDVRAYHVPHVYPDGLGPASTPVTALSAAEPRRRLCSGSHTFWFKPSALWAQHLRLAMYNGASIDDLLLLAIPSTQPPDRRCWPSQAQPHEWVALFPEKATLSRGLRTVGSPRPHASVESRGRTPGQILMHPPTV